MNASDRLVLLGECAPLFEGYTGPFDREVLERWLAAEFGHPEALDRPVPHGPILSQALAPRLLLHVVSGNTPHAAFQSLLRGLVVGARNLVKIPSSGLPELEAAVAALPPGLSALVTLTRELPAAWREDAGVVVVFGSDETIDWFRQETPATARFLPHPHRLSIALVSGDFEAAAALAAHDVSLFDQRGCLSLHDVYVAPQSRVTAREFAALLASEMERFNRHTPRASLEAAKAGAITSLREDVRFRQAAVPDEAALWESADGTAWTVVYERSPEIALSPLNRVVFVKPWPEGDLARSLGPARRHLASIAAHPFPPDQPPVLMSLGAARLCPLGATQNPTLFWHHDGLPPLASLVTWVDVG